MALPKYVSCKPNRLGREYYLYRRGRGTKNAWPTLRLPHYDDFVDFALRVAQYNRLNFDGDGWSYTCQNGKLHQIPAPDSKNIKTLWETLDQCDHQGQLLQAYDGKTFFALADLYQKHEDFRALADNTKKEYLRYLGYLLDGWSMEPVACLTSVDAQEAVDELSDRPAAARKFRAFFHTFIEFGIPRGFGTTNPVSHTKPPKPGEPYRPWPDWAFETFFEHGRPAAQWVVYTALYTGQRQGDVINMLRPHSQDSEISLKTQKVKLNVTIPMHPEFRELLKLYPSNANLKLHLKEDGTPWTLAAFRTYWTKMKNQPEFERFKKERIVFHGLRKNAVNLLKEAGANSDEVGAIVGMSTDMVEHYSRDVNMRLLARNCFNRIKDQWENVMPSTLPKSNKMPTLEAQTEKLEARKET